MAGIDTLPEECMFSSYAYYLAKYINNKDFVCLPSVHEANSSFFGLKVYNVLSFDFTIRQFGGDIVNGVKNFFKIHHKDLDKQMFNYQQNQREINTMRLEIQIQKFINTPNLIQVSSANTHSIISFIHQLAASSLDSTTINQCLMEKFQGDGNQVKRFFRELKNFSVDNYNEILTLLINKFSANKVYKLTVASKYLINKIKKVDLLL